MTKTRAINYVVKFDNAFVKGYTSLGEARQFIRDIAVNYKIDELPLRVQLVKEVTESIVLNEYEPKAAIVLASVAAFDDVDLA